MRIVLAAGLYPPDIGGPSRYAHMLATELPAAGITVTVVPYGEVRRFPRLFRHLVYAYRLWKVSRKADALYALDPMSVGLPACLVAKVRRIPFLVRLGGDYAWEQGVQRFDVALTLDEYTASPRSVRIPVRVLASVQRWVTKSARAVILPSQYLRSVVATWGVPAERLHVIYSAHTVPELPIDRDTVRADFDFTGPTLVSIARLTPWKGMDTLIKVVAKRTARGEATQLVIGGDGPERGRLEALVRELGVAEQVRFVGALSFDTVYAVVRAADIFLLDTAYEGLSHQLIEVMALGTPIVTTPVGGNTELLTHRREALLVPVGDVTAYDEAVSEILADQLLREGLIARARERALQFAAVEAVPSLVSLLCEICGSKHT